ncbi:hypothetical protein, partial [Victivallis vadensis]|uniref:hypothetical protein n=1 Tax=Victivallis vadensis TaxID=172901 RepID=UPI0026DBD1AB
MPKDKILVFHDKKIFHGTGSIIASAGLFELQSVSKILSFLQLSILQIHAAALVGFDLLNPFRLRSGLFRFGRRPLFR